MPNNDHISFHAARAAVGMLLTAMVLVGCGPSPQAHDPSPATSASLTATPSPPSSNAGAIAGHVNSPAEVLFPQLVYAISTAGASHGAYSTQTVWSQSTYTIEGVSPGAYYVYTTTRPLGKQTGGQIYGASYSEAVRCGLTVSCTSHKAAQVLVGSRATTTGIDPQDWYLPDGKVPAPPASIVPPPPPNQPPRKPYSSARDAAVAISADQWVDKMTACPVNRACTAVGDEHDGTRAAYFLGSSGSNSDLLGCGTYVFQDAAGWHGVVQTCGGAVFPAVGQSGTVSLPFSTQPKGECANVRTSPGPKGVVVACLTNGTKVRLDSGPVYTPMASTDGLWWHIAARGWMADDFLRRHLAP